MQKKIIQVGEAGSDKIKSVLLLCVSAGNDWWGWQGWRWWNQPGGIFAHHEENKLVLNAQYCSRTSFSHFIFHHTTHFVNVEALKSTDLNSSRPKSLSNYYRTVCFKSQKKTLNKVSLYFVSISDADNLYGCWNLSMKLCAFLTYALTITYTCIYIPVSQVVGFFSMKFCTFLQPKKYLDTSCLPTLINAEVIRRQTWLTCIQMLYNYIFSVSIFATRRLW